MVGARRDGMGRLSTRNVAASVTLVCAVALVCAAPGWAKGTIRWHGCGRDLPANLQCGELSVPLDYRHPAGRKIRLGFDRLRAAERKHRLGSLIVNPGGPGGAGSGVVAVEAAGRGLWHPALAPGLCRCRADTMVSR